MGRLYSISFSGTSFAGVAITAAQDLFEILVPSDAVMVLHSLELGQTSDAGDANAEILPITIRMVSGAPTSGSGGTTPTPIPLELGTAAAGITAEANNDTRLSGGTDVALAALTWTVQIPFVWIPTPQLQPVFSPSTRCVIGLEAAPADSLTCYGTAIVEEIGG